MNIFPSPTPQHPIIFPFLFLTISINFYLPSNIIHTDNMELIFGIRTETSYNIKHCYYATSLAISLSVSKQEKILLYIYFLFENLPIHYRYS